MKKVELIYLGLLQIKLNKGKETITFAQETLQVKDVLSWLLTKYSRAIDPSLITTYQIFLEKDGGRAQNIRLINGEDTLLGENNRIFFAYPFGGG